MLDNGVCSTAVNTVYRRINQHCVVSIVMTQLFVLLGNRGTARSYSNCFPWNIRGRWGQLSHISHSLGTWNHNRNTWGKRLRKWKIICGQFIGSQSNVCMSSYSSAYILRCMYNILRYVCIYIEASAYILGHGYNILKYIKGEDRSGDNCQWRAHTQTYRSWTALLFWLRFLHCWSGPSWPVSQKEKKFLHCKLLQTRKVVPPSHHRAFLFSV